MDDNEIDLGGLAPINDNADDDVVQSFRVESSALRGRVVRLGSVVDDVLAAHDYPPAVGQLVGEVMALCALLSSMLKYDGVFTLQAKGDGAVKLLVADMNGAGDLRGCATFDAAAVEALDDGAKLADILGQGYVTFTVQPDDTDVGEPYQGIVALEGESLVDCALHYFAQSEQIETAVKIAVGREGALGDGKWRAGGVMLQMMPEEGGTDGGVKVVKDGDDVREDWRRARILMESVSDDELLDAGLHSHILLHRLYHDEGVRVFEPQGVHKNCRCSEDKVLRVIATLSPEDLEYVTKDGKIVMKCEFCSHEYAVDPATL
ncbi:MAG: Hsp33 family molecular chaperone HslO [Alphaproteobacteria bacterium]